MADHQYISYEDFGRQFFETAVTEDRVAESIGAIAGDSFEIGPIAQGPGKLAKVTAKVHVHTPTVTRKLAEKITFIIRIPLEIDMVIDLRIDKPRFVVHGEISLRATARAAEPLLLIIDVEKPEPADIAIHVTPTSLRAELLRVLAGVDAEVKRFISAHVCSQIDDPESEKAQVIDVSSELEAGWSGP